MRWWEFYAVRYAVGTVVGAVMLWLLFSLSPSLRPLFFDNASATTVGPLLKLDAGQLSMLGIGGLVFCYVASAPILVLHAGRFLLERGAVKLSRWWTWLFVLVLPVVATLCLAWQTTPLSIGLIIPGFFVLLLLAITGLQWVVCALTLRNAKLMFTFYRRLSEARAAVDESSGITDSYRHLREHGNSFFIVLLEALLGLLLIAVGSMTGPNADEIRPHIFLTIFVFWTLPAVSVWLAATLLERDFALAPHASRTQAPANSGPSPNANPKRNQTTPRP